MPTIQFEVKLTLDSSSTAIPYKMTECETTITDDKNVKTTTKGFDAQRIKDVDIKGADFSMSVVDISRPSAVTAIGNWALVFIRRTVTSDDSPFGDAAKKAFTTGGGESFNPSTNEAILKIGKDKIKKQKGSWDWSLVVQVKDSAGELKCFGSDPEMDVDGLAAQLRAEKLARLVSAIQEAGVGQDVLVVVASR